MQTTPANDFPYFRKLWRSITAALFAAAFAPLILIGGSMYYYAVSAQKEQTVTALSREVYLHQKAIDSFLKERILDLKSMAETSDLWELIQPGALQKVFNALQPGANQTLYTDLGIIDQDGRHVAYVGPYDLISRNYKNTDWFPAVMASDAYISDLFGGFRNVPHFIVAVKTRQNDRDWIMRATIKAEYFNRMLFEAFGTKGDEVMLVNRRGDYQWIPHRQDLMMTPSGLEIPGHFDGYRIAPNGSKLTVMAWLDNVPWLCVVRMDRRAIFAPLNRQRNVGIFVFILGAILIGLTILLTTNYLVQRLEDKRSKINLMSQHLRQANRMTLSLHLYEGFFRQMNDCLANIGSAAEWIGQINREGGRHDEIRRDIEASLVQIHGEIKRSQKTLQELSHFSRTEDPIVRRVDVNAMLEELVDLFRREFYFKAVGLNKDFENDLPWVRCEPQLLRQVFQNLMVNALEAVGKNGEIHLKTRTQGAMIQITVADTGRGVPPDLAETLFDPLVSHQPGKLGLGLAICKDLLTKMGGDIRLLHNSGQGAAFTVDLPHA